MGANLLAQNNYDLARRFYVRAVQADPSDKTAQGYLGCTLVKLGRTQEASPFLTRAGQGPWSNCTTATTTGALPPNPGALTATPP
jgi:predicted Zn-dependent protease